VTTTHSSSVSNDTKLIHSLSLFQDAVAEGFLSHGDLGAGQRADSLSEEVQELED
jgi:hypothetical protein